MPKKEALIKKLFGHPEPKTFSINELDVLMKKCGCTKFSGGRGSSVGYVHEKTKRVLQFDAPHPGKELYRYQIKKAKAFLISINEIKENER